MASGLFALAVATAGAAELCLASPPEALPTCGADGQPVGRVLQHHRLPAAQQLPGQLVRWPWLSLQMWEQHPASLPRVSGRPQYLQSSGTIVAFARQHASQGACWLMDCRPTNKSCTRIVGRGNARWCVCVYGVCVCECVCVSV